MTNPYAPPAAVVDDIADPLATVTPADRGTRLVAAILDGIIAGAMIYGPVIIGLGITGGLSAVLNPAAAEDAQNALIAAGLMAIGLGAVGFIVWMVLTIKYVLANSQTIGKKLLNIKVVRADGSPVSFARLFWLRNVVNTLLAFVPLYGIVDHLFIFGESRQCLHDKLADTIVIQA
jgi:uncharacterized RDD family membrane protein YckC